MKQKKQYKILLTVLIPFAVILIFVASISAFKQREKTNSDIKSAPYKYETHLHTKEGSLCAVSTAEEMVDKYKELGYTGVIVTDHFFNGNSAVNQTQSWEKMIDDFCIGYENAKKRGEEVGIDVFFGWEYSYSGTDFLTYGLDKEWLKNHPETMTLDVIDYLKLVRDEGAMVIEAHPYRSVYNQVRLYPKYIDGLEVRNMQPAYYNEEENAAAKYMAEMYGLLQTSGSDAHDVTKIGMGGMAFDHKLESIDDYINLVKSRNGVLL